MRQALPIYFILFVVAISAFVISFNKFKNDNSQNSVDQNLNVEDENPTPSIETAETVIPEEWLQTYDEGINAKVSHPADWDFTPSPTEGFGGLVRLQGTNNTENIWIDIGLHESFPKTESESLMDYEDRRQEEKAKVIDDRRFILNDREYYQQTIELSAGGGIDPKKYGIYTIFEMNNEVYFAEAYTNNPFDQYEFVSNILASIN